MKKLTIQIKTLPTAIAKNSYSLPQTIFLSMLAGLVIAAGIYLIDPTSFNPYK